MGYVYTRYGRVGVTGVKSCIGMDFEKAVKEYRKVTRAKQRKGYTEIKMAGGKDKDQAAGGAVGVSTKAAITVSANESFAKSALPNSVQTLMKFFFDKSLMETSMVSVNVDVRRMPLGQLSKETVLKGYSILRNLEDAIQKGRRNELGDLSGQFYTNIPHNFGMKKMSMFIIQTMEQVKEKYDLITNLLDI